ncbi:MAG TPA: GAF domain-containing protein [Thermoanaerobaculia bacterium]|nr:GAF domain-containing protein [Thermoanaerobaculia bacterium]
MSIGQETIRSAPPGADERRRSYRALAAELDELLSAELDEVAAMATFAAVVHHSLRQASWTGFYRRVAPDLLRVGPYQGPLGCLEIELSRGVCGAAARERRTQVVADVEAFPGHIACDPASRSELVVPVFDLAGNVVAVLDLDSHQPSAFDELDAVELESLVAKLAPFFGTGTPREGPREGLREGRREG